MADILSELERDEGFRQFPYKDTVGKLTVGYGFNLESDGLSKEESECVLKIRVHRRMEELVEQMPWITALDDARQGVMLDMAYNLGVAGLMKFHIFLSLVREGKYEEASKEMLDSLWARQVGARATRLSSQMATGVWQ